MKHFGNVMTLAATMLALGSSVLLPRSANAGIIVFVAAGELGHINSENPVNLAEFIGAATVIASPIVGTIVGLATGSAVRGALYFGGLLVLNADGSLPPDKIVNALETRYPFIDNQEALGNLAEKIGEKASPLISQIKSSGDKVEVSLTPAEIDVALIGIALSKDQKNEIETDLGPIGSL